MWPLIKDFFTERSAARKAFRVAVIVGVAAAVAPWPTTGPEWLIRLAVAVGGAGVIMKMPSAPVEE